MFARKKAIGSESCDWPTGPMAPAIPQNDMTWFWTDRAEIKSGNEVLSLRTSYCDLPRSARIERVGVQANAISNRWPAT